MYDLQDVKKKRLFQNFARKRRVMRGVLILERFATHFWRPAIWCLFFCGLWLFEVPFVFMPAGPAIAWLIFIIGLGALLYQDVLSLHWPDNKEADKRLEEISGLKHRPLSNIDDVLANPDKPGTRWLWSVSREHIIHVLPRLKTGTPRPVLSARDNYALRMGVILFFGIGVLVAGPVWKERIWRGLMPLTLEKATPETSNIHLWITPPEYTKLEQVTLIPGDNRIFEIPENSTIKASVYSMFGRPVFSMGDYKEQMSFAKDNNYVLETPISAGEFIKISQFLIPRASWRYKLIQDTPPQIALVNEPEELPEGALRFRLKVFDDYGVENLHFKMSLDKNVKDMPVGDDYAETRTLISPAKTEFEFSPVYDLAAHPWAGLPVVITFEAEDFKGQKAALPPLTITLPEKHFSHPVAIKLIATRRALAQNPEADHKVKALELEKLLFRPFDFQDDKVVFLAIRAASSRLFWSAPDIEIVRSTMQLLWDTALKVEDGNMPLAARNLRDAQTALEKALKNPETSQEQISKLMNDLRTAMANYFMELQREMQKRMAEGKEIPIVPPELLQKAIDPDALAAFLDQLEAQMLAGDKSGAQEMLAQLQRMMDMINPSLMQPMPADVKMMSEGIGQLQELIERQQDLLDQTRNQLEVLKSFEKLTQSFGDTLPPNDQLLKDWGISDLPPAPTPGAQEKPPKPVMNTQPNKTEQDALRYVLGQLMLDADEALGQIPENMGLAEQEMRQSSENLDQNQPGGSIPHQEKALEYLKQGQQQLSQQLMQRMQQMTGLSFSEGGRPDPLGRPYQEGDGQHPLPGSQVEIPAGAERNQAHEILKLLRRRAGELDRPEIELDYYRRLLRQF